MLKTWVTHGRDEEEVSSSSGRCPIVRKVRSGGGSGANGKTRFTMNFCNNPPQGLLFYQSRPSNSESLFVIHLLLPYNRLLANTVEVLKLSLQLAT